MQYNKYGLTMLLTAGLLAGSLVAGAADSAPRVDGRRFVAPAAEKAEPVLLLPPPAAGMLKQITLLPLAKADLEALTERNRQQKRFEIGIGRALSAEARNIALDQLSWHMLHDGGQVATVQVRSPGAAALRAGIELRGLPKGLELRFYAPRDPATVFGPYNAMQMRRILNPAGKSAGGSLYWSPVIEGEVLAMELHAPPGVNLGTGALRIPQLSHLVYSVLSGMASKDLSDIGSSGACNIDIACEATWQNTADSVAKYAVTTSGGGTGLCTGTLLNDTGSTGTPYFLTANHCVSTQAEASTVVTYWFFQRETCGGAGPNSVITRNNGGQLLATGSATDFTLLELNDTPPNGVFFAGWDANTVSEGDDITALHHPSGDLKKISHGDVLGLSGYSSATDNPDGTHIRVTWSVSGTTEGGSSGSGLFNVNQHLVGKLTGGGAACSGSVDNGQPDWYGRFDKSHSCLTDWLGGTPNGECVADEAVPSRDGVITLQSGGSHSNSVAFDAWVDYEITVSSGATRLVVDLTNLSADADLYVRQGSQPQLDTYDCRSWDAGTADEQCSFDAPGAGTWYIGVYGFAAADYTVKATVTDGSDGGDGGGSGGGGAAGTGLLLGMLGLLAWRRRWRQ